MSTGIPRRTLTVSRAIARRTSPATISGSLFEHLGRPIQQIRQKRKTDGDEGEGNRRRRIEEGNNMHPSQHQEARCLHHRRVGQVGSGSRIGQLGVGGQVGSGTGTGQLRVGGQVGSGSGVNLVRVDGEVGSGSGIGQVRVGGLVRVDGEIEAAREAGVGQIRSGAGRPQTVQ